MKRAFFVSGILAAILGTLFLLKVIDFNDSKRDMALSEGNRLLEAGSYQEAFDAYGKGLDKYPEDAKLNYNSGQAMFHLGDYSLAAEYYRKSTLNIPERYLNMGNCSLKLGESVVADANERGGNSGVGSGKGSGGNTGSGVGSGEGSGGDTGGGVGNVSAQDAKTILKHYKQALEDYRQGILEFPQDVPLKYNYEYVQEKIRELEQIIEDEEKDDDDKEKDDNNQGGSGEDDDNQGGSGEDDDNQGGSGEDDDNQGGSGEDDDNQGGSGEDDNNQSGSGEDDNNQGGGGEDDNNQGGSGEDDDNQGGSGGSESTEQSQMRSVIENVLKALEKQEADSLKNNLHNKYKYEEEEYDW